MRRHQGWRRHFRLGLDRRRMEEEVEDELRFHMEGLVDRYVGSGMTEDEAWVRVREECRELEASRDGLTRSAWKARKRARRREMADGFVQDLRNGLRLLRTRPTFAAVVILTLALGIGANTAVFSVLRSVVLTPLPYPDPERLMTVWTPWEGDRFNPLSWPDWVDVRDGSDSFEAWGIWESAPLNLSGDGDPVQVTGIRTSAGVLQALGATVDRGRLLLPEETEMPVARVVVLSHAFWQRRFGGDPEVLGRDILINQEPWTVVGIFAEEFRFPNWGGLMQPHLVLPVSVDPAVAERGSYYLRVLGRLRADRSREQAHEELNAIAARLAETYPVTNRHRVVQVTPVSEIVLGDSPTRLWILLGVSGFVLLLACANVGGLLVARNLGRSGEMAVRRSLGASRGRLTRQLLTETMTLGLMGGGAGLLLAWWGTDLLVGILPQSVLVGTEIGVDGLVVSAAMGATLLTGLLTGVAPALGTPMDETARTIRTGSRTLTQGRGRGRLLGATVVVQFALAFVLVDGAGLMLQSLREATTYRELAEPGQVVVVGYLHPGENDGTITTPDPGVAELLRRVRGLPGVVEAGAAATLPFQRYWTSDLLAEGEEYDHDSEVPSTHMIPASPGVRYYTEGPPSD